MRDEANKAHPLAAGTSVLDPQYPKATLEIYQSFPNHIKPLILSLLGEDENKAAAALSALKKDLSFIQNTDNQKRLISLIPHILVDKNQLALSHWLRECAHAQNVFNPNGEMSDFLARELLDKSNYFLDKAKGELLLTLAEMKVPSPLVREVLKDVLKKEKDPHLRKTAIAATIFLHTSDPELVPFLPSEYQKIDPQWQVIEDMRRGHAAPLEGQALDRSLVLEVATTFPLDEVFTILSKHKMTDSAVIREMFDRATQSDVSKMPSLFSFMQNTASQDEKGHLARQEAFERLYKLWEQKDHHSVGGSLPIIPADIPVLRNTILSFARMDKQIQSELTNKRYDHIVANFSIRFSDFSRFEDIGELLYVNFEKEESSHLVQSDPFLLEASLGTINNHQTKIQAKIHQMLPKLDTTSARPNMA